MSLLTTSTQASTVIAANASRKSLLLQNTDTTDSIFVKREQGELATVSSSNYDIKLGPGASAALNSLIDGTQAIEARYTCVASANTPILAVFETEDIRR